METRTIEYKEGSTVLEGYLAYDGEEKKPAVIIVHDWYGVAEYAKRRAEQLAGLGYVAFAADIFGKGVRPQKTEECIAEVTKYRADRALMRRRVRAALNEVKRHPQVDPARIAVIGYCFGGGCALELARDGAEVRGVISFHGNLDTPHPDTSKIKAKVLVCHGADDPYVPKEQLAAFEKEMHQHRADWQLISYGNAVHSFTNPFAGDDHASGSAYNREADARSWQAMLQFFDEVLS